MKNKCTFYIILYLLTIYVSNSEAIKFSEIKNVEILNSKDDEFAPYYVKSKSLLIFNSDISGKSIYYGSIFSGKFAAPDLLNGEINNFEENQSYITFLNDYEAIISKFFLFDNRSNVNLFKINYQNGKFSAPRIINNLNRNYYFSQPTTADESKYIYFVSDEQTPNKATDIYFTLKSEYFSNITPLEAVNSPGSEITPFLKSEDTLFFSSNGLGGKGGFDIFMTVKVNGVWQRPVPLDDINSEYDDSDFMIINDNIAVFSSNRVGGKGKFDLYSADIIKKQSIDDKNKSGNEIIPVNISNYLDNIIVNKSIERFFAVKDNQIIPSESITTNYNPEIIKYNLEYTQKITIDSVCFYVNENKINKRYKSDNNEIIISIHDLAPFIDDNSDEIDTRLELYYNGVQVFYPKKITINENESIFNKIVKYQEGEYLAIEINKLTDDLINNMATFFNRNKLTPHILALNPNLQGNYEKLKNVLKSINKKINIEATNGTSMIYFKNM